MTKSAANTLNPNISNRGKECRKLGMTKLTVQAYKNKAFILSLSARGKSPLSSFVILQDVAQTFCG